MSILRKSANYAKVGAVFLIRMILPFVFGIILNWVFAIMFLWQWLRDVSWANSIPSILIFAIFLVGFPFTYFWLARGHAVKKGIEVLYRGGSHLILSKVIAQIVKTIVNKGGKVENSKFFKNKGVNKSKEFIKKTGERVPRFVRWIVEFVLRQVPLQNLLLDVGEEIELKPENLPVIIPKVQERVDAYVIEELIGAGMLWFWLLVGVNVLAFAGAGWLMT